MSESDRARRDEGLLGGGEIPDQTKIPWSIAVSVAWGSLRRRIFRSFITMSGVVLAIAFLTYMLVNDYITRAMIEANIDKLNRMLQEAGVDILTAGGPDSRMILLISLALFTCLVGIINAMLMSVTERVKEIGTMKCLGALNSFILKIYFIESSLQGVIGTMLGMVIGLAVALLVSVNAYHGYVFSLFPVSDVVTALVISLVVGTLISIIAAIAPANWAAVKEPVDAMRIEE